MDPRFDTSLQNIEDVPTTTYGRFPSQRVVGDGQAGESSVEHGLTDSTQPDFLDTDHPEPCSEMDLSTVPGVWPYPRLRGAWTPPPVPPIGTVFPITLIQPEHGTIEASLTGATPGTLVVVTAVPDEGYTLEFWGSSPSVSWVSPTNTNPSSFVMPESSVTITASLVGEAVDPSTDSLVGTAIVGTSVVS